MIRLTQPVHDQDELGLDEKSLEPDSTQPEVF